MQLEDGGDVSLSHVTSKADENTAKLEVQAGVEAKRKLEEDIEATINTAGFHVEIYTKVRSP